MQIKKPQRIEMQLTQHEKNMIIAYRKADKDYKTAIDKLLDVQQDNSQNKQQHTIIKLQQHRYSN